MTAVDIITAVDIQLYYKRKEAKYITMKGYAMLVKQQDLPFLHSLYPELLNMEEALCYNYGSP